MEKNWGDTPSATLTFFFQNFPPQPPFENVLDPRL